LGPEFSEELKEREGSLRARVTGHR